MDENTNTQAGQDLQSLQPQNRQTQQTTSGLQAGSGADLNNSSTSNILNQGVNTEGLSVGVASTNSRTSIAPPEPATLKSDSSIGPMPYATLLFLFIVIVLVIAYKRARKFGEQTLESSEAETDLVEEIPLVKKAKKKRRKPKRPHHH